MGKKHARIKGGRKRNSSTVVFRDGNKGELHHTTRSKERFKKVCSIEMVFPPIFQLNSMCLHPLKLVKMSSVATKQLKWCTLYFPYESNKMTTAPGVPRRSPIQVLTEPNVA